MTVYVLSLLLHSVGCYLLLSLYTRTAQEKENQQTLLLINVSAIEIIGNILQLTSFVVVKISPGIYVPRDPRTYLGKK